MLDVCKSFQRKENWFSIAYSVLKNSIVTLYTPIICTETHAHIFIGAFYVYKIIYKAYLSLERVHIN